MASEGAIKLVRRQYLEIMHWLSESLFHSWPQQWAGTTIYLSGEYQAYHQKLLENQRENPPCYVGILRCIHQVDIHHVTDNGDRCVVVDFQNQRRMATYRLSDRERIATQDLGCAAVVYEMYFDHDASRWKLDRFVQELPTSWGKLAGNSDQIQVVATLPRIQGRNN